MLTLTALRLLFADLPLILYLEQLILTLTRLTIKRNVVFIDICFTSKTHPLLRIFSIVAFGSCDSKGSLCFSHTGNAIFCMRRNCLKQGVRNLHSAWSYGAAGTCNNKSVYPRAYHAREYTLFCCVSSLCEQ